MESVIRSRDDQWAVNNMLNIKVEKAEAVTLGGGSLCSVCRDHRCVPAIVLPACHGCVGLFDTCVNIFSSCYFYILFTL